MARTKKVAYRAKESTKTNTYMLEIKLHEVIDKESNAWIYEWFGMDHPFTLETLQNLLNENPDEKDIKLQIHCDGGLVSEGLALYDCLRTSGRNIYCNVEGDCHSMAIVLLLAAPKSQRTANPNSSFLIHEVQGGVSGSTTAVERYAEEMRELQERIIDIYADRTGYNRDDLAAAMAEEKIRDAQYMLDHGFIGAINEYNTNQKQKNMFNWKEALDALLKRGEQAEKEGEQNGAQAAPANEIETLNARIKELEGEKQNAQAQIDTLTAERDNAITERDAQTEQVNNLTAERDNLQTQLTEAQNTVAARDEEIKNLKSQLGSHYQPGSRMNGKSAGEGKENVEKTSEERKAECREKLGWTEKK